MGPSNMQGQVNTWELPEEKNARLTFVQCKGGGGGGGGGGAHEIERCTEELSILSKVAWV